MQRPSSKILKGKQTFRLCKDDFLECRLRTCGVHVSLHRLNFVAPETTGLPGTDHLRTYGILVTYLSLAQGSDSAAGMPKTGCGCNPDSGSQKLTGAHRD